MAKEYIERGAAIEFVEQYTPHLEGETTLQCVESALQNVPAADVVEVVRCKDCKHWERSPTVGFEPISPDGSCERLWAYHDAERCMTAENHFCSYGERKEE